MPNFPEHKFISHTQDLMANTKKVYLNTSTEWDCFTMTELRVYMVLLRQKKGRKKNSCILRQPFISKDSKFIYSVRKGKKLSARRGNRSGNFWRSMLPQGNLFYYSSWSFGPGNITFDHCFIRFYFYLTHLDRIEIGIRWNSYFYTYKPYIHNVIYIHLLHNRRFRNKTIQ